MPHTGTALARFPIFLLDEVEKLGLDRQRLMTEADLSQSELEDPDARVQGRKNLDLWRALLGAMDDVDLGIRIGSAMTARDAGLVGYTMMHSPSLGEALSRLVRYGRILDDTYPTRMQSTGNQAEFIAEPLPEQNLGLRRMADFELAALLAVVRQITGLDLVPLEVHFPYRELPSDLSAHREFFRGRLVFDQPLTKLVLKGGHLTLPVRAADENLARYLDQLAEQVQESLAPGGSMAVKVERALWAEIRDGRPQLDNVAARLAMSPRTLQRRLREEGTTFGDLLDGFRHQMAVRLLGDRELAIYEIAYLLGYAEPSTFYRAFKRWTGTSPREFRGASD